MMIALPRWLRSTTARFVILIFMAQFIAVLGALSFMRTASDRALLSEQKALVAELQDGLVAEYDSGGRPDLAKAIEDRLNFRHGPIAVILLTAPNGKILAGNLGAWPPNIGRNEGWQVLNIYRTGIPEPENVGLMATTLPDHSHLLTGHVIDSGMQMRRANEAAALIALIIAFPLSLGIALLVGRIIGNRIAAFAQTARAVSYGDLSRRVATKGADDAFDHLAQGINSMLERIELLVSELRMVTDGLAHDLRSPLTRLRSVIERAVDETDDPACHAALDKVANEAAKLLSMLTTALQISRAEAGIGREQFARVALADLLADIVEIYGPVAEDGGFALTFDAPPELMVPLHRELMSQALGNLIENALNYAEGGGSITLTATTNDNTVALQVADDGHGIPEDLRGAARKRFGRLDPSRHTSGSGLGLSLAEAVVRLHRGVLELDDNNPGLIVRILLPLDLHVAGAVAQRHGDA